MSSYPHFAEGLLTNVWRSVRGHRIETAATGVVQEIPLRSDICWSNIHHSERLHVSVAPSEEAPGSRWLSTIAEGRPEHETGLLQLHH